MRRFIGFVVLMVGTVAPAAEPKADPALIARFGDTRLRHTGIVNAVAFHPDGKTIAATAEGEPLVRVWDVATGKEVRRYADPAFVPSDAAADKRDVDRGWCKVIGYTPDAKRLVMSVHDDRIVVLNTETGAVVLNERVFDAVAPAVAVSPIGSLVACRDLDGQLAIWDAIDGKKLRTLGEVKLASGNHPSVRYGLRDQFNVVFSPDGKRVAASGQLGEFHVGAVDGGKPLVTHPVKADVVWNLSWPTATRLVAYIVKGYGVYNPDTGAEVHADAKRGRGHWFDLSIRTEDGMIARTWGGWELATVDPDTLQLQPRSPLPKLPSHGPIAQIRVHPAAVAVTRGSLVHLIDRKSGKPVIDDLDRQPTSPIGSPALSADGKRLLVGHPGDDRSVRVWDTATGKMLSHMSWQTLFDASEPLHARLISPDGRWAVAFARASYQYTFVWDAETGKPVYSSIDRSKPDRPPVSPVGFDPDNRLWVIELESGRLRLLEFPAGKVVRTIDGFKRTMGAELSPDGKRLAVTGWEGVAVRSLDADGKWQVVKAVPESAYKMYSPGGCGNAIDAALQQTFVIRFIADGELITSPRPSRLGDDPKPRPAKALRPARIDVRPERSVNTADQRQYSADGRRQYRLLFPDGFAQGDYYARYHLRRSESAAGAMLVVTETATGGELGRVPLPHAGGFVLAPDGKRLYTTDADTAISVWDWPALEKRHLPSVKVDDRWAALAAPDPKLGLSAVREIAADKDGVAWLRAKFAQPIPDPVPALIAELGHRDYQTREAASKKLVELGYEEAAAHLREAAEKSPVPVVAERAKRILARLRPTDYAVKLRSHEIPAVRAVEAAERIGKAEAVELLRVWAKRDDTPLGTEAAAAVARLSARK